MCKGQGKHAYISNCCILSARENITSVPWISFFFIGVFYPRRVIWVKLIQPSVTLRWFIVRIHHQERGGFFVTPSANPVCLKWVSWHRASSDKIATQVNHFSQMWEWGEAVHHGERRDCKIHDTVMSDRQSTEGRVTNTGGISQERVHAIIRDDLAKMTVGACIPRLRT